MPSFDIVSEVDLHELKNVIDQANRELQTRYDFRTLEAKFSLEEEKIVLVGPEEFHLQQMLDILHSKCSKRDIDIQSLKPDSPQGYGKLQRQNISIQQGIDKNISKKITTLIKNQKLKVTASVQDEQVRVTGKKRNDLQTIIAALKEEDFDVPLQFKNFRD